MAEYIATVTPYGRGQRQVSLTDEEIVRCKDCVYYEKDAVPLDQGWPMLCDLHSIEMVSPRCYCAWGERR